MEAFLCENLPKAVADKVRFGAGVSKQELGDWTKVLNAQRLGRAAVAGRSMGAPAGILCSGTFSMLRAAPITHRNCPGFGFNMVGPAIIKYGNAEQKADWLPKIRNAELWFCQGYSEPEAGSDLASVRTRAGKDGDDYLVTGSKIWTSGAEMADWIFCLVRTNHDVQQQKGISFVLFDLSSPGVSVEPLYAFNGKRLWNQVFFDGVRVPMSQRLGDEDRGWTVAKSLLGDERMLVSRVAENKRILGNVREVMRRSN